MRALKQNYFVKNKIFSRIFMWNINRRKQLSKTNRFEGNQLRLSKCSRRSKGLSPGVISQPD